MRYLPHGDDDVRRMLEVIGVTDIDALFASIPEPLRLQRGLDLATGLSETELKQRLNQMGGAVAPPSFAGAGAYFHNVPFIVDHIISRTEFYSAYTPYQPEISQGTLQAIFEYQTMVAELTGLDVANASMYDGATATAEAVLMAQRIVRGKRNKVLVSAGLHPEYREVLVSYLAACDLELVTVDLAANGQTDVSALASCLGQDSATLVVQSPNFFGVVEDVVALAAPVRDAGAVVVGVYPEPVALGIMCAPGDAGVDIAVGEGLGLTGSLSFGGPGFGFFATRRAHLRQMPGRLCGATVDNKGQRGFVLTLSTREQHIRREKATSNICSNQGLCALAGSIALSCLGPLGLAELARQNLAKAEYAKRRAVAAGLKLLYPGPTFNEFVLDIGTDASARLAALADAGIIGGVELGRFEPQRRGQVLVCVTEVLPRALIDRVIDVLAGHKEAQS